MDDKNVYNFVNYFSLAAILNGILQITVIALTSYRNAIMQFGWHKMCEQLLATTLSDYVKI